MTEVLALEFTGPAGDPLRIEWQADALAALDPAAVDGDPVWRLAGELDWDEIEALRIVSGRLDDGRLIAIAALRPTGAAGHGEEVVAGALGGAEGFDQLAEALLSTEYGPDGLPRRVGLELYRDDGGLPLRVGGRRDRHRDRARRARRAAVSAALALRSSGERRRRGPRR